MKRTLLLAALYVLSPSMAMAVGAAPVDTEAREAILIDSSTGTVLYDKSGEERMTPSSMSKMMTVYLVFEALKNGKLKLDQKLTASEHAWKQEGSRMFINVGQSASVEDLLRGVIIQSGNDAAVVLAEALGGSEENFAEMENVKAQELGLNSSHFVNATGLPDPQHYSTCRDLAMLALHIVRDFSEDYHYFSEINFTFNNISQGNRNPLLYNNMNVDGLKTGHTEDGGYGLTASALRNGRRLVLVLNGMTNMQMRADESRKLLDWGYREFGLYPIAKAGETLANAKVWLGTAKEVPVVASGSMDLTLPRDARPGLKASISYNEPLQAPVMKGQEIGMLTVTAAGSDTKTIPLIAGADVPKLGFFDRITTKLDLFLGRS